MIQCFNKLQKKHSALLKEIRNLLNMRFHYHMNFNYQLFFYSCIRSFSLKLKLFFWGVANFNIYKTNDSVPPPELRYNLYNTKFTLSQSRIQWFLYIQSSATITPNSRTFLWHQKGVSVPIRSYSHFPHLCGGVPNSYYACGFGYSRHFI